MPATATAPKPKPRARARKPAARTARAQPAPRRAAPRPGTGRFVPVAAVGRTAVAVGGIADSGAILRLTRGRAWIGVLAALLVGIVALNVFALRFSATSSHAARDAEQLAQQNSALSAELATALSHEEVQRAATELGLYVPPPGSLRYREPTAEDAAEAARRLRSGELAWAPPLAPAVIESDPTLLSDPALAPAPPVEEAAPPTEEPATEAPEVAVTTPAAPPASPAPSTPTGAAAGGVGAP